MFGAYDQHVRLPMPTIAPVQGVDLLGTPELRPSKLASLRATGDDDPVSPVLNDKGGARRERERERERCNRGELRGRWYGGKIYPLN